MAGRCSALYHLPPRLPRGRCAHATHQGELRVADARRAQGRDDLGTLLRLTLPLLDLPQLPEPAKVHGMNEIAETSMQPARLAWNRDAGLRGMSAPARALAQGRVAGPGTRSPQRRVSLSQLLHGVVVEEGSVGIGGVCGRRREGQGRPWSPLSRARVAWARRCPLRSEKIVSVTSCGIPIAPALFRPRVGGALVQPKPSLLLAQRQLLLPLRILPSHVTAT